jgi:ribosomal protein S18 acetylase RimI-like enzyme
MDSVYQLHKHEAAQAGVVLNQAFQDDPVFNAIFTGATPEQRIAFFTTPVVYSLKYGQVFAPSEQLEGIAAWVPGKYAEMGFMRLLLSGAFWPGMKMGMELSQKIATVFKPVDEDRKVQMRGRDYLYLLIIGVAPQHQGQGFGGQLLKTLFADSEQTGLPIYLETETQENVSLYQHLGFKVINKVNLPLIDLPMWEMIREPTG